MPFFFSLFDCVFWNKWAPSMLMIAIENDDVEAGNGNAFPSSYTLYILNAEQGIYFNVISKLIS